MIPHEIMGLFCLAAFWVTVLLIALDVRTEIRDLLALRRRVSLAKRAVVVSDDGGAFATCALEQRGNALDGEQPAVDVSHGRITCAVRGGVVRFDDVEETIAADPHATVWLTEAAFAEGQDRPQDWDACVKRASSPRGYRRPLELSASAGDDVWLAPSFVSTFAPRPFVDKQLERWASYLALHVGLAAAVTALALSAPMDSWVAMLGATLCLAHYLSSPPMLRAVRAKTRTPEEIRRFWLWRAV
jgi:hypothetical protein